MALFKKKGETAPQKKNEIAKLPELPPLPELPDFSELESKTEEPSEQLEPILQLPSLPSTSLGNKFSRNIIKEAVSGKKEERGEADEFAEEMQPMRKPLVMEESEKEISSYPRVGKPMMPMAKEPEPIFIRIDRFEEGSQTFEEVKNQIFEVEKMFDEVKKIKEKEEKELEMWEDEIKQIKEKIESIDRNIFSKLE